MAKQEVAVTEAIARLPRLELAHLPTPLLLLDHLSRELNAEIWMKRDDLISFGLGGNKIRGLEFLLADALAHGADTLVTGAGVQSNHVRATAAAAAYCGLCCVAVFWGIEPANIDGNYRMIRLLGAESVFTFDSDRTSVDRGIEDVCVTLSRKGHKPYAIPRGGACALGAVGHCLAAFELHGQCQQLGIKPKNIVLATGSGCTQAGWLLGTRALGYPWKVEGFTVSREAWQVKQQITRLVTEAAALLGLDWQFADEDATIHEGFIGPGYGIPSPEGRDAIRQVLRGEGILLDPTYTGKAMAGLFQYLRSGLVAHAPLVFLHSGGELAFFTGSGDWLAAGIVPSTFK